MPSNQTTLAFDVHDLVDYQTDRRFSAQWSKSALSADGSTRGQGHERRSQTAAEWYRTELHTHSDHRMN